MKILYLVPDLAMGGVTTIVKEISESLKSRSHETYILTLKPNYTEQSELFTLKMSKNVDIFHAMYRLHKIVLKLEPDIIHSHTIYPNIITLLYKIIFNTKIKIINTEHGTITNNKKNLLIFKIYSRLSRLADKVSFVSKASMDSYVEANIFSKDKSHLIYNGIKIFKEHGSEVIEDIKSNNKLKFCFIGRMVEEKNIGFMIDVFNELSLTNKNIELYLIGNGILEKELKDLVKQKLIKNIFFLGAKEEVGPYIDKMDCILLSSTTESLPTVILESYAKKKNVISTNVGGVEEIIRNKSFLSKSNDKTEYLECLKYFCSLSKEKRFVYEQENYQLFLENFTLYDMVDNYENLYIEILEKV